MRSRTRRKSSLDHLGLRRLGRAAREYNKIVFADQILDPRPESSSKIRSNGAHRIDDSPRKGPPSKNERINDVENSRPGDGFLASDVKPRISANAVKKKSGDADESRELGFVIDSVTIE